MPLATTIVKALARGEVRDPFAILGLQAEGGPLFLRAWVRGAEAITAVPRDGTAPIVLKPRDDAGLFEALTGRTERFAYDLTITYPGLPPVTRPDVYAFWPVVPQFDLDLFRLGHHHHLGDVLGAHPMTIDGVAGVGFSVWAPNAARVSVVGDWNGYDGTAHPMRPRDPYGVWDLFIPGVQVGELYKYEIRTKEGALRIKADPMAWETEKPPATASRVGAPDDFVWSDSAWMTSRRADDLMSKPLAIYEVHLGSWMRGVEPHAWPNYRVLAQKLIRHCQDLGFNAIELLPVAAHPFEGSWGYQVTGQYAPNPRHGTPDDFRWFVDQCHAAGIAVLVDYVPGHFPKDDFALRRFDGTACYEYEDEREGEHKTWGTHVFNYKRPEVRNFLVAAALHWLKRYHIDGLRVDAVASMLYRDYDRDHGSWIPNEEGGNGNLEAVSFLQELTTVVRQECPWALMIAEESTAWKGVTAPTDWKGLGFHLKWNMGWMHDSLGYLAQDSLMRPGCHNRITFHQWYAYDDRWVLPLSHDEVVHGKKSLVDKMPGDWWRKRAQLRLLLGYQVAVPGRKLLFQGGEFGQGREFAYDRRVDWDEAAEPERKGVSDFLRQALTAYQTEPALHARDDHRDGFQWVDDRNAAESVLAFLRRAPGAPPVLVVCNFTPVPRHFYPFGVPMAGDWTVLANSDETRFGGAGLGPTTTVVAVGDAYGIFPAHLRLDLPPLAILLLRAPTPET